MPPGLADIAEVSGNNLSEGATDTPEGGVTDEGWARDTIGRASEAGQGQAPVDDYRTALRALYEATAGSNWKNNDGWFTDRPLNEWYGVRTDGNGRVIELRLGNNGLVGRIPPEIGELLTLKMLVLSKNRISGPLRAEVGKLGNLESLHLSGNQVAGEIPPELGRLKNLRFLYLGRNRLTGSIPPEIGQLTKLEQLHLSGNKLSGRAPMELAQLFNLRSLRLAKNQLVGGIPQEIARLPNLSCDLPMSETGVDVPPDESSRREPRSAEESESPPASRDLASDPSPPQPAEELIAGSDGDSPEDDSKGETRSRGARKAPAASKPHGPNADAGECEALTALYNATDGLNWKRRDNWLSDSPLGKWHGVRTDDAGRVIRLSLGKNGLTGEIPPILGQLLKLESLDLYGNELKGEIPAALGQLSNLEVIYLSMNQLTGEIPLELERLSKLETLDLFQNRLTGEIPSALGRLSNLV